MLNSEDAQDSEFRSFFGRIEDTINCFRDLLTLEVVAITRFNAKILMQFIYKKIKKLTV